MNDEGFDGDDLELEFLMERYSQLIEQQMATNEIIHTTFYISIVVFGALIGVIPQLSTIAARGTLYLFASAIFVAMFLWTRTYLNSRQELQRHMNRVLDEFESVDFDLERTKPVEDFFSEPADFRRDSWEQNWTKERMLLAYYLGLASVSMAVFAVDVVWRVL